MEGVTGGGVFISYSRQTKTTALRIRRDLQLNGITGIFLDLDPNEGIKVGSKWEATLEAQAKSAAVFLMLLSRPYLESRICLQEYRWARESNRDPAPVIVPIRIGSSYPLDAATHPGEGRLLDHLTVDDIARSSIAEILSLTVYPPPGDTPIEFERLTDIERDDPDHPVVRDQLVVRQRLWESLEPRLRESGVLPVRIPLKIGQKPYPGLNAFEEQDAPVFFGREAEVESMTERLLDLRGSRAGAPNLAVIQGASGAGKSSVLRAGVLSRLKLVYRRDFYCLPTVRPGTNAMTGDSGFITSLTNAFQPELNYPASLYRDDYTNTTGAYPGWTRRLGRPVAREEAAAAVQAGAAPVETFLKRLQDLASAEDPDDDGVTLLLPIDQAEELYPISADPATFDGERAAEAVQLRELLADLLERREVHLIVLMAIRSDSFLRLQEDRRLGVLPKQPFDLSPLPDSSYRSIIEKPAEIAQLTLDSQLVTALLRDLGRSRRAATDGDAADRPDVTAETEESRARAQAVSKATEVQARGRTDALPLLAFALNQLSELREGKPIEQRMRLDRALYDELGGIEGVIQRAVDKAVAQAERQEKKTVDLEILRRTFIPWLATVDPQSGQFLRRIAKARELPHGDEQRIGGERIAYELKNTARILRSPEQERLASRTTEPEEDEYEVAHEAVLRQWPLLRQWLENSKGSLWTLQEARNAAKLWDDRRTELLKQSGGTITSAITDHDRIQQWPQERLDPVWSGLDHVGSSRFEAEAPLRDFIRPEIDRLVEELGRPGVDHARRAEIGERLAQLGQRAIDGARVNFGDLRAGVSLLTPARIKVWGSERATSARSAALEAWSAALEHDGRYTGKSPVEQDRDGVPDILWCKVPSGHVSIVVEPGSQTPRTQEPAVHEREPKLRAWAQAADEAATTGAPPLEADRVDASLADDVWIARYPITYAQFVAFVGVGQDRPPQYQDDRWWRGLASDTTEQMDQWFKNGVQDQATATNCPAQYVTWYQAMAYCRWLTRRMKDLGVLPEAGEIRLPTDAEWVMAATAGDPVRRFPWGPDWNPAHSSNQEGASRLVAVGLYPANTSPVGAMDMAGNVYEWCLNSYDDITDLALDREVARATRGGAYYTQPFNRPVSHAQSVFHRFRDNPWGMTRGRTEPGTTRIAAGIRPVYQGPKPDSPGFQVCVGASPGR